MKLVAVPLILAAQLAGDTTYTCNAFSVGNGQRNPAWTLSTGGDCRFGSLCRSNRGVRVSIVSARRSDDVRRIRSGGRLKMSIRPPPPSPPKKKETSTKAPFFANDRNKQRSKERNKEDAVADFDPLHFAEEAAEQAEHLVEAASEQAEHLATELSEIEAEVEHAPIGIWTARCILLAVAILWGTNFASVKYLQTLCFHPPCNHPPSEASLARFGVAALASSPFLLNQRKDVILAGLECGAWITLGYFTQAQALEYIPAGKCAFICSLTVVIVPLISYLLYGKPIKLTNLLSAALAIAGVGVLEGLVDFRSILGSAGSGGGMLGGIIPPAVADASNLASSTGILDGINNGLATTSASTATIAAAAAKPVFMGLGKGDILALGQPLGFGLSFMRIEHYVEKFEEVDNRVLTISAAQCLAVGLLSLGWVLIDFNGHIPNMSYMLEPHRIGAIAWTGIMTTVVAIYFEGIALQVASATEAALLFASEPVWASLFGAFLLRERLNVNSYVGGAIILSACILSAVGDMVLEGKDDSDADGNGAADVGS